MLTSKQRRCHDHMRNAEMEHRNMRPVLDPLMDTGKLRGPKRSNFTDWSAKFCVLRVESPREHSGAEARRPDPGAHELERVLDGLPLHLAWTGYPDGRS